MYPPSNILALVQDDLEAITRLLRDGLRPHQTIDKLAQTLLVTGGKRLRPLILLLAHHATGDTNQHHHVLAAVIELIHTASLLHDDVIDASRLRRGEPTTGQIWGQTPSILAGDYLYAHAFHLLTALSHPSATQLLSETAKTMTLGELQQLAHRHNATLSQTDYLTIIHDKTASLFAAAATLGAAPSAHALTLTAYGSAFGMAYQLRNDLDDYIKTPEALGKPPGDDLTHGHMTLPLIHAMAVGDAKERALITTAVQQGNLNALPEILDILAHNQAIPATHQLIQHYTQKAVDALQTVPDSKYKEALTELAVLLMPSMHENRCGCAQ